MVAAGFAVALLAMRPAGAAITSFTINAANSQSPIFSGTVFAESGATYQKITATAVGELDPSDPLNAVIVDIALAPVNANGKVQYSVPVVLLKPIDLSKGNHRLFALIPNRGSPNGLSNMVGGSFPTVTPTLNMTSSSPGNGFLMRKGFSIVIMGWDVSASSAASSFNINTPVAHNADGSTIIGPSLEEFAIDNDTTTSGSLMYAAADASNTTANKNKATLSFRVRQQDPPIYLSSSAWEYLDDRTIHFVGGGAFSRGLYEFVYPAKDPLVAGIGLAAMRDVMAFLRYDTSAANPLANDVQHIYTHCSSQPCRTVHDYIYLGFNESESHQRVVDGVLNWIATGNFLKLNYRFSNSGRTHRQHINRWYPEFEFPFSNSVFTDSVTGKTDGRFNRCMASSTCPKYFEVFSENEYWAKAGSNIHFDRVMLDLPDPPNTRLYLMSSLPHGAGTNPGICQQFQNPLGPYPVLRALLMDLDDWVTNGTTPPATHVPRFSDGTLVRSLPQSLQGFPKIPPRPPVANQDNGMAVKYNGRIHTGDLFDYGPRYASLGIIDTLPPTLKGSPYPALVPKVDADGNDIAGIRLPEIAVPTATHTGWALRALPAGADDGCDASGQKIPFRKTMAGRLAIGDPRLSLDERYPTRQNYIDKVTQAAMALRDARLMLQEDVDAYVAGAGAAYDTAAQATP
jgi:hypothetical protein